MSYALVLVFDGVSADDYWKVNTNLGITRDNSGEWPAGMVAHAGGPAADGGWVVIEAWDSKESQQAFMAGRLGAALAGAGVPAPSQVIETNPVNTYSVG
jgi:hypothetical protein